MPLPMLSELQGNSQTRKQRPNRARAIFVTIFTILTALVVSKVIDYRSHPPPVSLPPSPERLDALRYLTEARTSAQTAGDDFANGPVMWDIAAAQARAGDLAGAKAPAKGRRDEGARALPEESKLRS